LLYPGTQEAEAGGTGGEFEANQGFVATPCPQNPNDMNWRCGSSGREPGSKHKFNVQTSIPPKKTPTHTHTHTPQPTKTNQPNKKTSWCPGFWGHSTGQEGCDKVPAFMKALWLGKFLVQTANSKVR
jgi:hypothetical protein